MSNHAFWPTSFFRSDSVLWWVWRTRRSQGVKLSIVKRRFILSRILNLSCTNKSDVFLILHFHFMHLLLHFQTKCQMCESFWDNWGFLFNLNRLIFYWKFKETLRFITFLTQKETGHIYTDLRLCELMT